MKMVVTVDGVTNTLDTERLTLGEARAFERCAGTTLFEMESQKTMSMTVVQALLWVTLKRKEPTLKFVDLDDRPISDFVFQPPEPDEETAEPDPTQAATAAWRSGAGDTSEDSPKF
jgi:hypothetical protein